MSNSQIHQPKLTRPMLMKAAGTLYFGRGEEYFDMGMVESVHLRDGTIEGVVNGTHVYRTQIKLIDGRAVGICTCPLGDKGRFCKHLVATGLAFIDQEKNAGSSSANTGTITLKEVAGYLAQQEVDDLVDIIMQQANRDDEFRSLLKIRVAAETTPSMKREMKSALRRAMYINDFVSWRETNSYSSGVERVLEQLRNMLSEKHAADIVDLVEYGLDLWEEAIELIDDSDGCMSIIRDDLHELHLAACTLAKPEPEELAKRMALRAIESGWDIFYGAYEVYHDIFGETGRARYRQIVEEAWKALPILRKGHKDPERYGRSGRLERMMLSFTEEDGDLDQIIGILSRDLSEPYQYLRVAKRCRAARRHPLAIEWAEKGLAAFGNQTDARLRSFLAEEYARAKRPDDALAMVWENFVTQPVLKTYRELADSARKLKRWDDWREKAFDHIRADIKQRREEHQRKHGRSSRRQGWFSVPPDHSLLVEILLWEKRDEEAWEEARQGGCSHHFWLELARRREQDHPQDVLNIYRQEVVPLIERTHNRSYEEAVEFLGKIHRLSERTDTMDDFREWLTKLKTEYKRKRNFIKFVERRKWGK